MNITIAGAGYVGLSNAMLLSQNHKVIVFDVLSEKIDQLNNKTTH
jgi:UDPglucose 6-dehydrogenase